NPAGFGDGESYLGSSSVTTDGSGNASFTATLSMGVAPDQLVTATAIHPSNNTSLFSNCQAVAGAGAPSTGRLKPAALGSVAGVVRQAAPILDIFAQDVALRRLEAAAGDAYFALALGDGSPSKSAGRAMLVRVVVPDIWSDDIQTTDKGNPLGAGRAE